MDDLAPLQQHLATAAEYLREADPLLAPIIEAAGPLRLELHDDYFEALVSAIIAQQLSDASVAAIRGRFMALFTPERPFSPASVAACSVQEMRSVGLSEQKARYLHDLANRILDGSLDLAHIATFDDEEVVTRLLPVKGIGRWTAEMFLIFSLGRLDVLPVDDLGLRTAVMRHYGLPHLPKHPDLIDLAEPWRPYRTVATLYLWRSLNNRPAGQSEEAGRQ